MIPANRFPFAYSNPEGEDGTVVVIRHGERMDEVKEASEEWDRVCRERHSHCRKTLYCRINDPPLTENGKQQARDVALSLKSGLTTSAEQPQVIFSSKLIRSLMTAYEIAKEMSLPICVSRGFSLTAAAVAKKGKDFTFLSLEEMQELCPGVQLIDGDENIFPHPDEAQLLDSGTNIDRCGSPLRLNFIPDNSWEHSLRFLSYWKYALVVAHRESIRNLAEQYVHTPYCCYGVFNYRTRSSELRPMLQHLADRNGSALSFKKELLESDDEEVCEW
eukprot:CAMPEP_0114419248 /NCGR_PEP_ID=MMETSP0103-20121206/3926_1 /TAXON_ID=37642 ORGANISM="Paraphysomonas imperforata, Strain PA2" /NCGR_SAMPLE_ID=MMETSP0103 /ASSEMBLY_ACC=CAM_ASM_000201 /LENGTH=274 /DNA_ID=CAMNT_0001587655 /DNA_START=105 /DNA_END=929 /DNA_ORIENTATION=+